MATYSAYNSEGLELSPTSEIEVFHSIDDTGKVPVSSREYPSISEKHDLQSEDRKQRRSRRPWIAILLAVLTVGAAVGGGVGGGLAARKKACSTAANSNSNVAPSSVTATNITTTTSNDTTPDALFTNLAVPPPTNVFTVDLACPSLNATLYTSYTGQQFTFKCGLDSTEGKPAASGNGTVRDIIGTIAYSFSDCVEACAQYNKFNGNWACYSLTFRSTMNLTYSQVGANCFLKNATSNVPDVYPGDSTVMTALLYFGGHPKV